ncbi:hypothetical protein AHiyo8_51780 [Arthrobacter sp. Hiyo8]|nr:hypothetical protein AHiyo8_51780 [Arthrobacter sp. Hiyo8]
MGVGFPQIQGRGIGQFRAGQQECHGELAKRRGVGLGGAEFLVRVDDVRVDAAAGTEDREIGQLRGETDVRTVHELRELAIVERVARPVDLLATGVRGNEELSLCFR